MAPESWITPEETPALAAEATTLIDTRLARLSEGQRLAFWASIRKAYNTPYNPPAKATRPVAIAEPVEVRLPVIDLPIAAIAAAALAPEAHAA